MATVTLHKKMPMLVAGTPIDGAQVAMIMLHGRGATAEDILGLAREFDAPATAFIAPQAANATWYPNRFIAPIASNEPWLTSALDVVDGLVNQLLAAGLPASRIYLLGFSQGGCLALEYAARHPQRYGGVIGLSAALIENGDQPRTYSGSLEGTPVFLGCSDADFHIPAARVDRSAQLLRALGGEVDLRIYPGLGHTVNRDELNAVQQLLKRD